MSDVLPFRLQVVIMEGEGLKSVPNNRLVYCTMEVEGKGKLQTDHVEAAELLVWNNEAEFKLNHPLPTLKVKIYVENPSVLALEDKELGKITLKPTLSILQMYAPVPEWYPMTVAKNSVDRNLKIKLICQLEGPESIRYFGFLYAMGKVTWKKWKRRYHILNEVSDRTYKLISYKEKKTDRTESIFMDGYFVDYIEKDKAQLMMGISLKGGQFFFTAVKEGDSILLASEDEKESRAWITFLYKATGQANKPIFPQATTSNGGPRTDSTQNTPRISKK